MHSRKLTIDNETTTLTFGHEGVLYKSSFVMYDDKTNTKWNHSTGRALAGPLAGRRLKILPSRLYRWSEWKKQNPQSQVLIGERREGAMGTYTVDREPGELGISTGKGPRATLYPFDILLENKVINDTVLGRPVIATIDPESREATIFSRKVQDRILNFSLFEDNQYDIPLMRDDETQTLWDRLSGEAIQGELQGASLNQEVAVSWKINRWLDIYDEGILYGKDRKSNR